MPWGKTNAWNSIQLCYWIVYALGEKGKRVYKDLVETRQVHRVSGFIVLFKDTVQMMRIPWFWVKIIGI